jgi:MYXO-CTERM domain-containing protein
VRGRWGGPPRGEAYTGPQAGKDLAHAPRGKVSLPQMVAEDVPEIDIKAAAASSPPSRSGSEPSSKSAHGKGCGCQTSNPSNGIALAALLLVLRRRKR